MIETARGSPECSGISASVYNILRDYINTEPSCVAAHVVAASLYTASAHSSATTNSFLSYGSLVLAVEVLHAVNVTEREGFMSSTGLPEGHGAVIDLNIAVGLGSEAVLAGASASIPPEVAEGRNVAALLDTCHLKRCFVLAGTVNLSLIHI